LSSPQQSCQQQTRNKQTQNFFEFLIFLNTFPGG
jgi:hypothetical protein